MMQVKLKHELYRVKSGFAAHSPELGLTAHGYSPETARRNLERVALFFFRPFERQGNLIEEVKLLGLKFEGDGVEELTVSTAD